MGMGRTAQILSAKSPPKQTRNNEREPERMLSLPQAARYLGISESTIRRYVKAETITYKKVGDKLYRFFPSDLDAFIEKSTKSTA